MLYQEVISGIIYGVTGQLIRVEVEMRNGLPYFTMVGYLSKESTEAKERVASALRSVGHPLPAMKITVNLSPANIRKNGTAFDFPIAVAFLACLGKIPSNKRVKPHLYSWRTWLEWNDSWRGVLPADRNGSKKTRNSPIFYCRRRL